MKEKIVRLDFIKTKNLLCSEENETEKPQTEKMCTKDI